MSKKLKDSPGIGQYVVGTVIAGLAISAGSISLAMNFTYGAKTSLIAGCVFVITDLKITLPMAVPALGGWNWLIRSGYSVAVIMSIIAASSYLLETHASRSMAANGAKETVEAAKADAGKARQELRQIAENGDPVALQGLYDAARAKADREAARGGCGKKCEAAQNEAAQLLARLSQAKRRAELEAQLAEAKQVISATPITAVGAADNLAALTGLSREQIAAHEAMLKSIVMLMALELIAAMSGLASRIVFTTFRQRNAVAAKNNRGAQEKSRGTIKKAVATDATDEMPYWHKRLLKEAPALYARAHDKEITWTRACILAGIRSEPKKKSKKQAKAQAAEWTQIEAYA